MKYYRVDGVFIRLERGAVAHLTHEQAAARRHQVSQVQGRPDVYTVLAASTFKRGEEFGCEARPAGEVLELELAGAAFEARILRERSALAAWKASELARRGIAAPEAAAVPGIRRRRSKAQAG